MNNVDVVSGKNDSVSVFFREFLPIITFHKLPSEGTPNMGAMCVAMPFTEYQGFKTNGESPTSQLVGGECEEDMILGLQMANRLSQKVGWPVYVSCSLGSNIGHIESFGHDATNSSLAQYATALSEKTVMKILMEKKMQIEN
mmetsp:Transcript_1781/g.2562  ORF Transcript_1781/g.2562 Transcript_1781/m.2562 type:complete len:142 (-) Transcript_1781:694-1119(-)